MTQSPKVSANLIEHNMYLDGAYLEKNPHWHIEESPFKARQIVRMMEKNHLKPKTVCEVGCGAGEVLKILQKGLDGSTIFWGYDISPQALEMCQSRANEKLQFKLADISQEEGAFFDLLLVLDVFEHIENYYGFLRGIRSKGDLKMFHIPLDLSVQAVARKRGLLTRRELYGHIQQFTKDTALETLRDAGYEILDYFYTPRSLDLANDTIKKIAALPRRLFFTMDQDLAVRILGGYSLMVLAR
jgi:cyclopropane fatty-acyl-phospholipid synthase-like methyltransferase